MIVQTFYNGIAQAMRSMIDAAAGGTLMSKTEGQAYNLIEEMTLNHHQWSNECGQPKSVEVSLILMPLLYLQQKWMP